MPIGKIVVYGGGRGILGAACLYHFKLSNWWVANVDLIRNDHADINITVPQGVSWEQQEEHVLSNLKSELQNEKVNAVVCIAGRWTSGSSESDSNMKAEEMWRQSVWRTTIAATIATRHLANGGLLAFTWSRFTIDAAPGMISNGMAKAAIHHLTRSLGGKNSGLPHNSIAVAIIPESVDTEINRKWTPDSDFSTSTPVLYVAHLLEEWIRGKNRPESGSLVSIITRNYKTLVTKDTL